MDMNYFDIVVGAIILLLGLKGVLNGFFKEVFGLIGIIGGIFVASRVGESFGKYLSDAIFHFENQSAISFTGFLVTLGIFWLAMVAVGVAFAKLSKMSGLGPVDKILGFVFGASKFFLIVAVISFAVNNIKSLKPTIDSTMSNSVLFPVFVSAGSYIMKIDPVEEVANVKENIDKASEAVEKKTNTVVNDTIKQKIDEINTTLNKVIPQTKN